jgi:hypothetical protein
VLSGEVGFCGGVATFMAFLSTDGARYPYGAAGASSLFCKCE